MWFARSWRGLSAYLLLLLLLAASAQAQPAPAHTPILLVPGWFDDAEELSTLRDRLLASGWREDQVIALGFVNPVGSNVQHAREIAEAVDRLRAANMGGQVDVVAHSMGGLATRRYLNEGGAAHVRRVVFLATPHRGTVSSYFAWGQGAKEMHPESPFLTELLAGGALPAGIRALTIRTPLDLHILPGESATLPGVPDQKVCCPTHAGLLDHRPTFELIRHFLSGP